MARRIEDGLEGSLILFVDGWSNLYKVFYDGDMFYTHRDNDPVWRPVVGQVARESIWQTFSDMGHRLRWREENGKDIFVKGFERKLGTIAMWYVCDECQALYTDNPRDVQTIQRRGCTQPDCPNNMDRRYYEEES